jgi:hypothetical protein
MGDFSGGRVRDERHEHDEHVGDEGGRGRRRVLQAHGLEHVPGEEQHSGDDPVSELGRGGPAHSVVPGLPPRRPAMRDDAEHGRPDQEANRKERQRVDPLDRLLDHDEGRAEEERRHHQRGIGLPAGCGNGLCVSTLLRGEGDGGFGHGTSHPVSTPGLAVLPIPCPEGETLWR